MTENRLACPKTQNIPVFIVKTLMLVTHQYNEMQIPTNWKLGLWELLGGKTTTQELARQVVRMISTNNNLVNRKLEDMLSGKFPPIPVR